MKHNYPEHYSKNAASAIKLAKELKLKGGYDFFRGQKNTYSIQPSIMRSGINKNAASEKLNEFANWVHNTPELNSLHNNIDAILAVAQHYGLKTPLLDFSHSPEIAGFFAIQGGVQGETGTIICINKKRFQESWKDINETYHKKNGIYLTEIIEIDVKNLWRLQAQQGLFLKCYVDSMLLEMFSWFLHIYFPQKNEAPRIDSKKIYPIVKSHLEVLLDQYFLIDSYPERDKKLDEIFETRITISEDDVLEDIKSYFITNALPETHNSWKSDFANSWLVEPNEKYTETTLIDLDITLPQNISDAYEFEMNLFDQIEKKLIEHNFNKQNINWIVKSADGVILYIDSEGYTNEHNDYTEFTASQMINSMYWGMRNLPYKRNQIIKAMSRYLTIVQFGVYEVIDDAEGIEFSGGNIRNRGFCSSKKIVTALREDFFNLINPSKLNLSMELEFRDILFSASHIKTSYIFENFLDLFVEDVIPTIAAVAAERLVIMVNPMRIDVFGES